MEATTAGWGDTLPLTALTAGVARLAHRMAATFAMGAAMLGLCLARVLALIVRPHHRGVPSC